MHVQDLLDSARSQAGLDDFGNPSFREGLDVYVSSLRDEAGLSEIGRLAIEAQIVTNLVNRLQVVDWMNRHPELEAAKIERPVFIVGLPRTGTTFLSYLLDLDPEHRSLMRWEAQTSVPPPRLETFTSDPRIAATQDSQNMLDMINPDFKAIHYEAPDGPTECVSVTAQDFKSVLWETVANVPSYGAWLRQVDYGSAYRYHKLVLQLLQSEAPGRWMLKSPAHCFALDTLLETYPDARFVATHRDPTTIVASTCSLAACLSGTFSEVDHRDYIARRWTESVVDMLSRVEALRASDPSVDARFVDLRYVDLVADPVASVRRVYEHIGSELSPPTEAAVATYAAANRQGKYGRHSYSFGELGLDAADLRDRFAAYRERYEIPEESVPA